jgi:ketosteroid isomerase-like protein
MDICRAEAHLLELLHPREGTMSTRRGFFAATLLACAAAGTATAQPSKDEASLREALAEYERVWNLHDVKAWTAMLDPDIQYNESGPDFYGRDKGRDKTVGTFSYNVENSDMQWEARKIVFAADGTATVVHRHVAQFLPKKDGKYATVFVSEPAVSRWRRQDGRWRMIVFTTHKGWSLDLMKKNGIE